MALDVSEIRKTLLEVIDEFKSREGHFQTKPILTEAAQRLRLTTVEQEQGLLTAWSDVFRVGLLAWGYNLANPLPPHVHLTEIGRQAFTRISRDPYNPAGYAAVVHPLLLNAPIARSYIDEAINTFQAGCFKATAVMVGAAAESLVLDVRDALVARLNVISIQVSRPLNDWKVKTVRDAIETEITNRASQIDNRLKERFNAYWIPVTDQMRVARNDAGHPTAVDPVTHEVVHATLLLFPELASLVNDLIPWISSSLT